MASTKRCCIDQYCIRKENKRGESKETKRKRRNGDIQQIAERRPYVGHLYGLS